MHKYFSIYALNNLFFQLLDRFAFGDDSKVSPIYLNKRFLSGIEFIKAE